LVTGGTRGIGKAIVEGFLAEGAHVAFCARDASAAVALSAANSPELIELGVKVAKGLPSVTEILPEVAFNASEDVTLMIERVQSRGGKAMFALFGTPIFGGHHNAAFDVDETVIANSAEFLAKMQEAVTA
jgi:aminobenzoyl-glutamate utilization protein A